MLSVGQPNAMPDWAAGYVELCNRGSEYCCCKMATNGAQITLVCVHIGSTAARAGSTPRLLPDLLAPAKVGKAEVVSRRNAKSGGKELGKKAV